MWRSMREINGKSQLFKYAGCHRASVIADPKSTSQILGVGVCTLDIRCITPLTPPIRKCMADRAK